MADNPFLDSSFEIKWSLHSADKVKSAVEEALARAEANIGAVKADIGPPNFNNTFLALERATEQLRFVWHKVTHLDGVKNSPDLREAYNQMLPLVTGFFAKIPLDAQLWTTLKTYSETGDAQALKGVKKRFLEETLADFREAGADLPAEGKERLEAIEAELAQVTQKYSENVLDGTNAFELVIDDPARLAGLPELALDQARLDAEAKGYGDADTPKWRFTLHMPSLLPVMKYADDAELRRTMWEASAAVGRAAPFENAGLILEILKLRSEKAQLLGRDSFADHALSRRMAKTGAAALAFVEDLHERIKPAFDRECEELCAFKAEACEGDGELEPWDLAYWSEKLRRARYAFDDEEVRPFLPLKSVLQGLFMIAERLFYIRIKDRPTMCLSPDRDGGLPSFGNTLPSWAIPVQVWDPGVKFYEIRDGQNELLGGFYTDWHPREDKRGGAWMDYLLTGRPTTKGGRPRQPHLGLICGNLTPPGRDGVALLDHNEVQTVFHEFGHLLHHLLGEVTIKSLNGVDVALDFVELPSQLMENWCWERDGLDLFAEHFESGGPIPDSLFDKMLKARNFQSAMATMRQLAFAKMDLEMHLRAPDFEPGELDAVIDGWLEAYKVPTRTPAPPIVCRFSHLFSSSTGYAAGYYSYKWAEALDADAFTRFKEEGVLNPDVGMDLREKILARGNAADPAELFRDFMGRDPDPEALLLRSGLAEPAAPEGK